MTTDLKNDTLVLVAHGSTTNPDSSAAVRFQAGELARRAVFAQVLTGFWKEQPALAEVLREATGRRVFVTPFFVSEGYFTEEVIPREMGLMENGSIRRRQARGSQTIFYTEPVGVHPKMTEVLLARAAGVVASHPFPRAPKPGEMALFIAGHGTLKNDNSRKSAERQAGLIRGLGLYREVQAVFMEEEPKIEDLHAMTTLRNVVVVPFFMSDGLHVAEDIPVLLGEAARVVQGRLLAGQPTWRNPSEKKGRLLWYAGSVGGEPALAEVIVETVLESLRRVEL